jgi:hypothetical protein
MIKSSGTAPRGLLEDDDANLHGLGLHRQKVLPFAYRSVYMRSGVQQK